MDPQWAAENLQVIRTLMERSSIYRRALAPVLFFVGVVGVVASVAGWSAGWNTAVSFVTYWFVISLLGGAGAYLLVRRQAIQAGEPFWSPPTRRVTQALLPPLVVGFLAGLFALAQADLAELAVQLLPPLWMMLYGCALNAAGFFMQRGIKLFGWIFIAAGALAAAWLLVEPQGTSALAYALMGGGFGGVHLAYAGYLVLSKSTKNET